MIPDNTMLTYLQAKCVKTGPGQSMCVCDDGWKGDGTYCYPLVPCGTHSDCHTEAKCVVTAVGQVCSSYAVQQHYNSFKIIPHQILNTINCLMCTFRSCFGL